MEVPYIWIHTKILFQEYINIIRNKDFTIIKKQQYAILKVSFNIVHYNNLTVIVPKTYTFLPYYHCIKLSKVKIQPPAPVFKEPTVIQ
jgi:hypothetical protein